MTVIVFLGLKLVIDDLPYKLIRGWPRIRSLRATQGGKR